jgi:hypothetical protein
MTDIFKKILIIAGLCYLLSIVAHMRFSSPAPGILAPLAPEQTESYDKDPVSKGDYIIYPLADFYLEARVLATERYRFDNMASLAPLDVAFGWGAMSDSDVLKDISIWQGGRFYFWSSKTMPISADTIVRSSANMHLIPSTNKIRDKILSLRRHDLVQLEGFLVEVKRGDGFKWKSSLSREDSGRGSCEVIWVTSLSAK